MEIVYEFLGWNIKLGDEEDFRADTREINVLLQQLSPGVPEVRMDDVNVVSNLGYFILARDMDAPRGNGHRIVGMATLTERRQLTGRYGYIDDVVVDEAYRGHGIGEQLTIALIEEAKSRGLRHIDLTSNPQRVAANKLYLGLGFVKRETNVYRLKLD